MTDWQPLDSAPINVEVEVYFAASDYVGLATRNYDGEGWTGRAGRVEPLVWRPKPASLTEDRR